MAKIKCGCTDCKGQCPITVDVPAYAVNSYARCDHCTIPNHDLITIVLSPSPAADEIQAKDDG